MLESARPRGGLPRPEHGRPGVGREGPGVVAKAGSCRPPAGRTLGEEAPSRQTPESPFPGAASFRGPGEGEEGVTES